MSLLNGIELGETLSMQEIPAFNSDELPQALQACATHGIAKVKGLICELSLRRLHKRIRFDEEASYPAEILLPKVIDLQPLYDLMNTHENIDVGMRSVFGPVEIKPTEPEETSMGHVDTISPFGITALSHIYGPKALFAASPYVFEVTDEVFMDPLKKPPCFFDEYGPGDTLLLRQAIRVLNGEKVDLPPMIHDGVADEPRELLALDFRSQELWLPVAV